MAVKSKVPVMRVCFLKKSVINSGYSGKKGIDIKYVKTEGSRTEADRV